MPFSEITKDDAYKEQEVSVSVLASTLAKMTHHTTAEGVGIPSRDTVTGRLIIKLL